MKRAFRVTAWIGIGLLVLYGVVLALLWSQQTRLIYPAPRERAALSAGFTEITLETADDLALRAFHRPPANGLPTIVYFHGNGGSLLGATYETDRLAQAGYGLLLVEYRGYGGNPGEPSEQGLYRDGRAAMEWLARQGTQPGETIIAGNSIGSGPATQMALEYKPRALILSSPFTTLQDVAAAKMRLFPVRRLMRDRFDNLSKISDLAMPVLVLHGTADTLIPDHHGKSLAAAAPKADLVLVKGAGHGLSFQPEAQEAILTWLGAFPGS